MSEQAAEQTWNKPGEDTAEGEQACAENPPSSADLEETESHSSPSEQTALLPEKLAALEAVLFMAAEPISPSELADILGVTPREVELLADELAAAYVGRGLQLSRVAGGFQVCTRPEYGPFVAKLHQPERFRLSRASLETLAIVAYKQPVTRPEIEAIRGVNSDSAIETLMQYQLICEAGRKDAPGRPMLYRTTESFLGHFGLNSVEDLPRLDSIPADEDAVRAEVNASLERPEAETSSEKEGAERETPEEENTIPAPQTWAEETQEQ